jgi:hypothetical protein
VPCANWKTLEGQEKLRLGISPRVGAWMARACTYYVVVVGRKASGDWTNDLENPRSGSSLEVQASHA